MIEAIKKANEASGIARASRPDARECAMLIARMLEARQSALSKELTRARLAEITLKKVSGRRSLDQVFVNEVRDWLLRSGWILFFAGTTYAVMKTRVLEGWGRVSSKGIEEELKEVMTGRFNFDQLERLLIEGAPSDDEPSQDD